MIVCVSLQQNGCVAPAAGPLPQPDVLDTKFISLAGGFTDCDIRLAWGFADCGRQEVA